MSYENMLMGNLITYLLTDWRKFRSSNDLGPLISDVALSVDFENLLRCSTCGMDYDDLKERKRIVKYSLFLSAKEANTSLSNFVQ